MLKRNLFSKYSLWFLLLAVSLISNTLKVEAQTKNTAFTDSILVVKSFPLFSVMQQEAKAFKLMQKNKTLNHQSSEQRKRIEKALQQCATVDCLADSIKWKEVEIQAAGGELIRLYKRESAIRDLVAQLRKNDSYALFEGLTDTAYLRQAWLDAALGTNRIINVYLKGEAPRYVKIDSISFEKGDTVFKRAAFQLVNKVISQKENKTFFTVQLQSVLGLLALNGRDEAARYEPLASGLNKAPFLKVKATDFSAYPYSLILIPGLGPETPGVVLDPKGAERCKEGVARYRKGLAPFIVVSGGNVHPFQTPYNEAVEMKKYIVEELGVPADVVFIEPHARHTTTNLRNTSRMIYRFGIPTDKPVLIVTDASQSSYILGRMEQVALRDLNYVPFQKAKKISEMESSFYPVRFSLHADPYDPLDP